MKSPNLIKNEELKNWVIFYLFVSLIVMVMSNISIALGWPLGAGILKFGLVAVVLIHLAVMLSLGMKSNLFSSAVVIVFLLLVASVGFRTFYREIPLLSSIVNYSIWFLIIWWVILYIKRRRDEE